MQAINWGAFDMVGEESGYVRTINAAVLKYIPNCRSILSSLYFRNFCDKFAASFCPAFLNLIQKQRRISEEGTQQLLLDLYNLKKMMLDLPRIGSEHEINVPVSYRKYVEKHMSKVERLLKLVATPVSMLVEHFRMMWPEGGNKELQVVMSLKGMKRTEQITVLETFGGGSTSATGGGGGSGGGASSGNVGDGGEEDGDLKARAMKGMKGAMDDFQKISSGMTVGMKTAFR
jgi:vacuolar protein sorting-associated protein 53